MCSYRVDIMSREYTACKLDDRTTYFALSVFIERWLKWLRVHLKTLLL